MSLLAKTCDRSSKTLLMATSGFSVGGPLAPEGGLELADLGGSDADAGGGAGLALGGSGVGEVAGGGIGGELDLGGSGVGDGTGVGAAAAGAAVGTGPPAGGAGAGLDLGGTAAGDGADDGAGLVGAVVGAGVGTEVTGEEVLSGSDGAGVGATLELLSEFAAGFGSGGTCLTTAVFVGVDRFRRKTVMPPTRTNVTPSPAIARGCFQNGRAAGSGSGSARR